MAPFYESDLAKERWTQLQWQDYELWEKIEARERNKKRLWIALTGLAALVLFAVPIVVDQFPRWRGQIGLRRLAQEILRLKRDAISSHQAFRLGFSAAGLSDEFAVEWGASCEASEWNTVRTGRLAPAESGLVVLQPEAGQKFGIPNLVSRICYDPLGGMKSGTGSEVSGFALISRPDLEEARPERIAVLTLSGPSGEVDFE